MIFSKCLSKKFIKLYDKGYEFSEEELRILRLGLEDFCIFRGIDTKDSVLVSDGLQTELSAYEIDGRCFTLFCNILECNSFCGDFYIEEIDKSLIQFLQKTDKIIKIDKLLEL